MHVCEADEQRAYLAWDLFESTRSDLSALLRLEDSDVLPLDVTPSVWRLLWDRTGKN
ncbi:hypothetical protein JZ785_01235 [Alicyclobacillus curvatus]|jgi:hypothetical protein|nr:hypothetical protein JZ785_01235 [Alicyclobacillus curvatus]